MKKILTTLCLGLALTATSLGQGLQISKDPYNNAGEVIRGGLPVEEEALLPNIIYPYLPSGNVFENWGAKDVASSPNLGAVEAIIIFMAQTFRGKSSGGATSSRMWQLCVALTVLGLMLSSFLTFKAVTGGKKGPGEAIVGLVIKSTVLVFMFIMICPNLPPLLIGLSNYVTSGIDGWFSYTAATGKTDSNHLDATYKTKMAEGVTAAGALLGEVWGALENATDPELIKAGWMAIEEMKNDPIILAALGKTGEITNGLADIKALYGKKSAYEINAAISAAAQIPAAVVAKRAEEIIREQLADNASGKAPEPVVEQALKAPQTVDISGIVYPDRLLGTYGYIAFCYLALSIWGLGFASLVWAVLYSLPEEWNLSGILFSGIKGGLTIVLSVVLIAIYLGSGLNWAGVRAEEITTAVPTNVDLAAADIIQRMKDGVSAATAPLAAAWSITKFIASFAAAATGLGGRGDVLGQALSSFTGMTLEQFMIGLLILTAPAQAAMMVKGANGIGEKAAGALNANGAASQGIMGMFGAQQGGSGATAGSNTSAAAIMSSGGGASPNSGGGSNSRAGFAPSSSPWGNT
jgi:hypothetical protein